MSNISFFLDEKLENRNNKDRNIIVNLWKKIFVISWFSECSLLAIDFFNTYDACSMQLQYGKIIDLVINLGSQKKTEWAKGDYYLGEN